VPRFVFGPTDDPTLTRRILTAPAAGGRFVDLSGEDFAQRFGAPDTSAALSGYTPPSDTAIVLTLVLATRPRRLLEIGRALGHMTANLTAFSPEDAVVYSIGVAGVAPRTGAAAQTGESPPRGEFARHLDHFGTGHKAMLVTTDSRGLDFSRFGTLDFVFVGGGHDHDTVRSDSLKSYAALRPGGCLVWHDLPGEFPWVEVEKAVAGLPVPEPVYRVAGTRVAFLLKGDGVPAAAGADSGRVAVAWDGEFAAVHSLARVNRAVCSELVARGHDLARVGSQAVPPDAVTVRHRWPPDFSTPASNGPFVLIQPWEYGRLPRAWVEPVSANVDEVWCYSRSVLRAYVASGVPEDRVAVVPPGVDPDVFRPDLEPLPLPTAKSVKLLFVGGTIPRKGFDTLLAAYRKAFTSGDDVALVVKEFGASTFYRGQTAGALVERHQADPASPEVVYLPDELPEEALPRLYAACDALVHPYRGEGFGLPVLEAMGCGRPVLVTAGGPTDEFVPASACWRVAARVAYFPGGRVGDLETAGPPWWLEPDGDTLVTVLREVVADPAGRRERGAAARRAALGWTWARTASAVEDRVRVLGTRTPVRFRNAPAAPPPRPFPRPSPTPHATVTPVTVLSDAPFLVAAEPRRRRRRVSLTMIVRNEERNLPDCLSSVRDLVDEAVVVDTGSTDRTKAIADSFGCVLGDFPWVDDFAAARNAALGLATGDYIFWMDADDRLDGENRRRVAELFEGLTGGNDAFAMKCFCVPTRPGDAGTVVDHVRLFRNRPDHRWTYRVHEQILPALRATGAAVRWSGVTVRHVGYVDPALRRSKLARDLRLLRLSEAETPDDPFVLFNLGCVHSELGDTPAALAVLTRSLKGSDPKASIVRKLYALIAGCHARLGDHRRASDTLRAGREYYPEDAELMFLSGVLAAESGDVAAAEDSYRRLIGGTDGDHFGSVDPSLRSVKGPSNLAALLADSGRDAEAEALWRRTLASDPMFLPAHHGLAGLYLNRGDDAALDAALVVMRSLGPGGQASAAVLAARRQAGRGDVTAAATLLEQTATEHPRAVGVHLALARLRLTDGSPPGVAEALLRRVLELDPDHPEAQTLLRGRDRSTDNGVTEAPPGEGARP
jgi:glycosyltransferase involved in cell wall biosynthesis/tetratricopeptide (TPR) repeat protein